MAESKFLTVAKQAALEAGEVVKKYYTKELDQEGKGHFSDFATRADLESEAKVIEVIKKNFPDHNIIAEESGTVDNGSEYTWAIDPIDGTIPFVDGLSTFGISVGLLKNKKLFVGAINMVAQNEIFWAEEGKGAFKNGKRIQVRKESVLKNSTISLEPGHVNRSEKLEKEFKPILEKVRYFYVFGAAVKSLTSVAEGKIDGSALTGHPWDFAAGAILVIEAGGKVTDPKGEQPDFTAPTFSLISTNGLIHEELLEVYK